MRVVFAATSSLDSPYGGGRALPLARALARQGIDTHIVTLHHNLAATTRRTFVDGDALHADAGSVTVHYVGQMHVRKIGDTSYYFTPLQLIRVMLTATFAMTRILIALRPDIIHIGKPHPQNVIAAWIAALVLHIDNRRPLLILDSDDIESQSNRTGNSFAGNLQRAVLRILEEVAPRLVDGVTTHTTFLAQSLQRLGIPPEQIYRLPNPVDPERFAKPNPMEIQEWLTTVAAEGSIILYVGTLSLANHPVHLLLAAFAIVHARQPSATLVLAGGGGDLDLLRDLAHGYNIADATHFLGRVPANRIPDLYAIATVTVDPVEANDTARARWPLKIVESLAAGVPVVTGDIGDRRTMLTHNDSAEVAGALVPPGDAAALADAIAVILLVDVAEQAALRTRARQIAARYASELLAAGLLDFYRARAAVRGAR